MAKGSSMSFIAVGKLIYLAHPRTASVATERALVLAFGGGRRTMNHHDEIEQISDKLSTEMVVTTIRDPLDLIVSWFVLNPDWHALGLNNFIKDYGHSALTRNGHLFYHLSKATCLLRYERLQDDLNAMLLGLGLQRVEIPTTNVTKNKKDFLSYHTPETINNMWRRFPWEMSLYHERLEYVEFDATLER